MTKKIKTTVKNIPRKGKSYSDRFLLGIGLPLAILAIICGYFIWDIVSPIFFALAFITIASLGIPLVMFAFRAKRDIVFLGVFAWVALVFFARFIFGGGMLYGTDTMGLGYFAHSFFRDYIRQFLSFPLWEPFMHGGMPFVEAMHGDIFYPTRILELILPLHYALGIRFVLHIWLAGFFMFGFLRKLRISRAPAFFGGLTFMLGGFLVSYIYAGHDGKVFVLSLLPLSFWALESALEDGKLWRYLLFGLTYSLMILSAHMQMAYFAAWAIGAYFILRIIRLLLKKEGNPNGFKPALKNVAFFIVAIVIAIGITTVQLYPPFKYLGKYSQRTQRTEKSGYNFATSWSLHPEELGSLVVPEFAGVNVQNTNTYWGRNAFKLNSDYFGVVVLVLALGAVIFLRNSRSWFFFWVSVFATIYALGANTFFFRIFYEIIPQVKKFRGPSMLIFLSAFGSIVLASLFLDIVLDHEKRAKLPKKAIDVFIYAVLALAALKVLFFSVAGSFALKIWKAILYSNIEKAKEAVMFANIPNFVAGSWLALLVLAVSLGAILLAMRKKISPGLAIIPLVLATGFDLVRVDKPFVQIVQPKQYFSETEAIRFLKQEYEKYPFRTMVTQGSFQDSHIAIHGLEEVVFGVGHGNQLRTFDEFIDRSRASVMLYFPPAPDLLGIEYIALDNSLYYYIKRYGSVPPEITGLNTSMPLNYCGRPIDELPLVFQDARHSILKNPWAIPKACAFYDWVSVDSAKDARNIVFSGHFAFDRKIAIEGTTSLVPTPIADTLYRPIPAKIKYKKDCDFTVEVDMVHDGFLFIGDNWYPEWKAYENEKEIPIFRANGTFRAVPLTAGRHEVRFVYVPKTVMKSLNISLAMCGLWVIIFVVSIIIPKGRK